MEFLGMTVEGEGGAGEGHRVPQLSVDDFKAAVATVLAHEEITGIAWTQYTPYFNDGEPCVFSVGEPDFRLAGVTDPADEDGEIYFDYSWQEEDFEENGRLWVGPWNNRAKFEAVVGKAEKEYTTWDRVQPYDEWRQTGWDWKKGSGPLAAPDAELFLDVHHLIHLMNSGQFDHACEDLFGDHATIIIDKVAGKVTVSEYYHD